MNGRVSFLFKECELYYPLTLLGAFHFSQYSISKRLGLFSALTIKGQGVGVGEL